MVSKITATVILFFLSTGANASYFYTSINIGQTLAVSPVDSSQVSQYSSTLDIPALTGIADLFSGAYIINYGYAQFNFNQQQYLANTTEDLVFTGSYSYLQSAQSQQITVGNEQYNYVVDFYHEDYYTDMRTPAEAVVDVGSGYPSQTTYFHNWDYVFNREEFIVPPGTTGTVERHTHFDSIDGLSDYGYVWFDYYGYYGGDGVVDYIVSATNGMLDLDSIDIYLEYQPTAAPVPAAAWLFGSGLVGLIGIARRKKLI